MSFKFCKEHDSDSAVLKLLGPWEVSYGRTRFREIGVYPISP